MKAKPEIKQSAYTQNLPSKIHNLKKNRIIHSLHYIQGTKKTIYSKIISMSIPEKKKIVYTASYKT